MNSQFGLLNVWTQGDIVTRGVFLLLLTMSLASWMVIIIKALDLRRFSAQSRATESYWRSADLGAGLAQFGTDASNPFRSLALEARDASAHLQRKQPDARSHLHDGMDGSDWITRCLRNSIDESTARLQS